ncbi:nitric oxide reductase activation protein NorD [Maritimibacter dapengensis]|uniref:Nitric oxide reductase D protein n=1 Tax=Maritimibacter dapengensis TaxID=2836868 RepID=A0ABS6T2H8_9RHOB|nr:nitric oxide reductase D protein [Maritimibacter dapengensis]MBV7378903.1 nitric oxide reductase D protein [Maritimibacter dapengensis]
MTKVEFEPWEPEETVGKLWHAYASRLDAPDVHDGARVDLSEVGGRLAVLFRGLGGGGAVEIKPAPAEHSHHRLSLKRRLGTWADVVPRASFDGAALRLPASLAVFPAREANAALYLWLAAAAASANEGQAVDSDPLRADLLTLHHANRTVSDALAEAPGYARLYEDLCGAVLALRHVPALPPVEADVEAVVRRMLGDRAPLPTERARQFWDSVENGDVGAIVAPRRYRPFRPVVLWPDLRELTRSDGAAVESRDTEGEAETSDEGPARRARRRKSDQIERADSFILHKFEAILSFAEFVNLNRRIEEDDNEDAKKAADDQDEIGLGQISKAPATKLKLHLDLAPEDVDTERLSDVTTYPEWNVRTGAYLPDHCRVLSSPLVAEEDDLPACLTDPRAKRRIRAVKRQFEALRPGRVVTSGHPDGDDLDVERAVRSMVELRANGQGTDRVWLQSRTEKRDLAVSLLLDVSRSTEAAIPGHGHEGRSVIDVEREALSALAWGLEACGDMFAVHAFSSLKRDRVYVQTAKRFDEPMSRSIEARIGALKPGFYTRLGAAMRHVSADLSKQGQKKRLLLVITDGKPNDLDHYEGRHGIEDSRMAVLEARRAGHAVFGVTVDRNAKAWFPRIFGQGGFAVIPNPDRLTTELPRIYRELVGG